VTAALSVDIVGVNLLTLNVSTFIKNIFIRVITLHRVTAALSVDIVGVNLLTLNVSTLS